MDQQGVVLLEHLRDTIGADELEASLRSFAGIAGTDRSSIRLREVCGPDIDLARARDRDAVLVWLRSWGCRHLRREDSRRSSEALRRWWEEWRDELPARDALLTELTDEQIAILGRAYTSLARRAAARSARPTGDVEVTFGDTAAAKGLYALRPQAVPPWDAPIRRSFGWLRADADAFASFLTITRDALTGLSGRLEIPVAALPRELGRPDSSAVKLVDEFLWVRITRGP